MIFIHSQNIPKKTPTLSQNIPKIKKHSSLQKIYQKNTHPFATIPKKMPNKYVHPTNRNIPKVMSFTITK